MPKHARTLAALTAAGALLAAPAIGLAAKPAAPGSQGKAKGTAKSCAKVHGLPFVVGGTLVSATADDPATPASEATMTITVTSANAHAAKSGELTDQNATKKGVQVKGATYTVAAGDAFTLKLNEYVAPDTPSVGDAVKIKGKMALAKKRCAAAATSTADRYAAPDITKVTISDRDAD